MKMNPQTAEWSQRYQKALRRYLFQEPLLRLPPVRKLGCQAVALGMETLALAQIHEQALQSSLPPGSSVSVRTRLSTQAKRFFEETNSSIENTHVAALKTEGAVKKLTQTLLSRTAESKIALKRLKRGILQRKMAEAALVKSGTDHAKLLKISKRLRTRVRDQTQAIILNQEKERTKMSLGLQDTVAQSLLGIHIELLALKASDQVRVQRFSEEIDLLKRRVGKKRKVDIPSNPSHNEHELRVLRKDQRA
jgi:signal transduction histidine kinase